MRSTVRGLVRAVRLIPPLPRWTAQALVIGTVNGVVHYLVLNLLIEVDAWTWMKFLIHIWLLV